MRRNHFMPLLFLILFGIGASLRASAPEMIFRNINNTSGLPDNNIRNITMLPSGLVCIQTATALNLFNGASCESYTFDPQHIPYSEYNGQNDIFYDPDENELWLSALNRHWLFDMESRTFDYDIENNLKDYGLPEFEPDYIFLDSDGHLIASSREGIVYICNRKTKAYSSVRLPEEMKAPYRIAKGEKDVWILSMNGYLARLDSENIIIKSLVNMVESIKNFSTSRFDIKVSRCGKIVGMFDRDLLMYDSESKTVSDEYQIDLAQTDLFTSMDFDSEGNLWVGTARSGAYIIDFNNHNIKNLNSLHLTSGNQLSKTIGISKIYKDLQGSMWIGTETDGIAYYNESIVRFENIERENIRAFLEENDGSIILATGKGILRYDLNTGNLSTPYKELSSVLCISLYKDNMNRLWVGTFYDGLYRIDDKGIKHFMHPSSKTIEVSYQEKTPNLNCVRTVTQDSSGHFWISVYGGIGRFDPETGEIHLLRDRHPELAKFMIVRDITILNNGTLIACGDNGSFEYSIPDDKVLGDMTSKSASAISYQTIFDNRGLRWYCGSEGLFAGESGKPVISGHISSIVEDEKGDIWASSLNKIYRVIVSRDANYCYSFAVTSFDKNDGVDAGTFFEKAVLRHSNGNIFFGGSRGVCIIQPAKTYMKNNNITPYIADFQVGDSKRVIPKNKKLILKYNEIPISFAFTNLNYANPSHSSYRYRLLNLEKNWNEITSQKIGMVRYTFIPPGKYTLEIQSAYNGTDWCTTPEKINITVKPPFWRSTLAKVLYFFVIIAIASLVIATLVRKAKHKREIQRIELARRQEEELNQMKFRFFTNISHELRTPLTLILLPLESLQKEETDENKKEMLNTIYSNATDVLNLVNHLLDFRSLEMGGEKLNLVKSDIGEFIENIINSFRDSMSKRNINLELENNLSNPMMAFDSSQMQKIVNNLLSNAMKFTPEGGLVTVKIYQNQNDSFCLDVCDTGIGISKEDQARIFDRFYRSKSGETKQGTGIGLSLVKQYVEMHKGKVYVESELGKGSTFHVVIPTNLDAGQSIETQSEGNMPDESLNGHADVNADTKKRKVMVVDDNDQFREYLCKELAKDYSVSSAKDGEECLNNIQKIMPDILVCDVMMPKMDGFALTKAVKNDIETSHIPVILLTARINDECRLEGYETGADAYLTKPFKMEILKARIKNLIEERQKRINRFAKGAMMTPREITFTTVDEKLMSKIMESVEKNIDNANYSVENLASDVNMHRMSLFRKIQSLTGLSPSEFIRSMRLKRAAQIIAKDPNLPIGDVAMMVGFNTTKYFTKYFKEMYGVSPSHYNRKSSST